MRCLNYIAKFQLLMRKSQVLRRKVIIACFILIILVSYALFSRRRLRILSSIDRVNPTPSFIVRSVSKNASTADFSAHHSIPRIIHQIWKSKDGIPQTFKPWMESWIRMNSNWDYWFWTDEDMRNLVSTMFPEFLSLYDSYPSAFYRADAFRYFLLYAVGGVYADLDMECLRSFDDVTQHDNCVLSQEPLEHAHFLNSMEPPLVSNALMACRPHHTFFENVISRLESFTGFLSWNDILHCTGPFMLTEVFKSYHASSADREDVDSVRLSSPDEFQPHPDDSMVDHMRKKCRYGEKDLLSSESFAQLQKSLCQKVFTHDFGQRVNAKSFSNHHWTHTWAGKYHDPWAITDMRIRFPIDDLLLIRRQ